MKTFTMVTMIIFLGLLGFWLSPVFADLPIKIDNQPDVVVPSIEESVEPVPLQNNVVVKPLPGQTIVELSLDKPAPDIIISILSSTGQVIRVLSDQPLVSGQYTFIWDGKDGTGVSVSSSTYTVNVAQKDSTYREAFAYQALVEY